MPVPTSSVLPAAGRSHRAWSLAAVASASLAACGGGGGSSATAPTPNPPVVAMSTVEGVAAVGAPLAGAAVSVKCAGGGTATATASSTGTWSVSVPQAGFPCMGRAVLGGTTLHSVVDGAAAMGSTRMNITPLTEWVVAQVTRQAPSAAFNAPAFTGFTEASIRQAVNQVLPLLPTDVRAALGSDNPISVNFRADGTGHDAALDLLRARLTTAGTDVVRVAAELAAGTAGGGILPSYVAPIDLKAKVGETVQLTILGRPLSGATTSVALGALGTVTGAVSAAGTLVAVKVPETTQALPVTVRLSSPSFNGAVNLTVEVAASQPSTPTTPTTPTTPGALLTGALGSLTLGTNLTNGLGAPVPLTANFADLRSVERTSGGSTLKFLVWSETVDPASGWSLDFADDSGGLAQLRHGPTGFGSNISTVINGSLGTGLILDLINGSVKFTNFRLNNESNARGQISINGSLKVPTPSGTQLTFGGPGVPYAGKGLDAPTVASPVSSSLVPGFTTTEWTWTSTDGLYTTVRYVENTLGDRTLLLSNVFAAVWTASVTANSGIVVDKTAGTVVMSNVQMSNRKVGNLVVNGTLKLRGTP